MIYFTADEHYGHSNIIKYCNRPFTTVKEMDETLIKNHNQLVRDSDLVYHLGDFAWSRENEFVWDTYIDKLNGAHFFIQGSHDRWLHDGVDQIYELKVEGQIIILCHYAMRVWPRSHYNSWQLYGHSHGKLKSIGKSYDVGVDNNGFKPVSFEQLKIIMSNKPNNFNLVKKEV